MNDLAIIPLTQGKFAIVDASDYEWLRKYKWKYDPDGYAIRNALAGEKPVNKRRNIRMHRQIMDAPKGVQVDHRDGFGLYNRRHNLRVCTKTQNGHNRKKPISGLSSRYKGVCLIKKTGRWQAKISVNHKSIYLGCYPTQEDAAIAYDEAALLHFGEYARLNILMPKHGG